MKKYYRLCPKCKKKIFTKNKYYCTYAEKNGALCSSCGATGKHVGIKNSAFKDISGQKFNYLTAIRPLESKTSTNGNSSGFYWEFRCECGRVVEKHASSVKRGLLKSCGCKAFQDNLGSSHGGWKGHGEISSTYFGQIKAGALSRNIKFDITIEEIWQLFLKQNGRCALTGRALVIETQQKTGKQPVERTASLDRIDSEIGYVLSNVQWVHKDVNLMKFDLKQKDFLDLCEEISRFNQVLKK